MAYNPRQLPLIPVTRRFGKHLYGCSIKLPEWGKAQYVARTLRKKDGHKVIITKDDAGWYEVWVKILVQITTRGKNWLTRYKEAKLAKNTTLMKELEYEMEASTKSLCPRCRWGERVADLDQYICEYGAHPSTKKRQCKYYEMRESDGS